MKRASLVTSVSIALAQQAKLLGPPGMDVEVVYNGVDDQLFCPSPDREAARRVLGLPEDQFYWVSVCRLVRQKGTEELAAAFRFVARRCARARLLLIGDGPEAASLKGRFSQEGLGDRVILAGQRPPEEVARWLQAADAFVLASHAEGLPNVILEAMASGLPVVATDVGGTREAVLDRVSGLLVPPREVQSLTDAMLQISQRTDLSANLGAEGRKRVEQQFGWRASALRWIEVYENVLRASRVRP